MALLGYLSRTPFWGGGSVSALEPTSNRTSTCPTHHLPGFPCLMLVLKTATNADLTNLVQVLDALRLPLHRGYDHLGRRAIHTLRLAHHRFRRHPAHGNGCRFPSAPAARPQPGSDDLLLVNGCLSHFPHQKTRQGRRSCCHTEPPPLSRTTRRFHLKFLMG